MLDELARCAWPGWCGGRSPARSARACPCTSQPASRKISRISGSPMKLHAGFLEDDVGVALDEFEALFAQHTEGVRACARCRARAASRFAVLLPSRRGCGVWSSGVSLPVATYLPRLRKTQLTEHSIRTSNGAAMKKPVLKAAAQSGSNLLKAMEVFEAVAETGQMTAAARMLGMTQSAASQQIAALEKSLWRDAVRPLGAAGAAHPGGHAAAPPCGAHPQRGGRPRNRHAPPGADADQRAAPRHPRLHRHHPDAGPRGARQEGLRRAAT